MACPQILPFEEDDSNAIVNTQALTPPELHTHTHAFHVFS